jgi:hypothetical protein
MTSYHQRQGAVGVPPEDAKMKRASTTCKECQKRRTRVQTTSHPPFPSLPYPTLSLSRSLSPPSFCPRCVLSSAIWTFSSVDPSSALYCTGMPCTECVTHGRGCVTDNCLTSVGKPPREGHRRSWTILGQSSNRSLGLYAPAMPPPCRLWFRQSVVMPG